MNMNINSMNLSTNNCCAGGTKKSPSFSRLVVQKNGDLLTLFVTTVNPAKDNFVSYFDKNKNKWAEFGTSYTAGRLTEMIRSNREPITKKVSDIKKGINFVIDNIIQPNLDKSQGFDKKSLQTITNIVKRGKPLYSVQDGEEILGFGFKQV